MQYSKDKKREKEQNLYISCKTKPLKCDRGNEFVYLLKMVIKLEKSIEERVKNDWGVVKEIWLNANSLYTK